MQKNIVLPEAQNFNDLEQAPIIAVSKDSVTLDGRMVADATVLNQENTADWKITELHDELVTLKNNYKLLHPSEDWKGMVIVQADKGVDFKVVKKVMYSCAMAGYQNVNFAVQQKSKGGESRDSACSSAARSVARYRTRCNYRGAGRDILSAPFSFVHQIAAEGLDAARSADCGWWQRWLDA